MSAQLHPQPPSAFGRTSTTKKWLVPVVLMTMMILSLAYLSGYACKLGLPTSNGCPILCPPGTTCINIGGYWACL